MWDSAPTGGGCKGTAGVGGGEDGNRGRGSDHTVVMAPLLKADPPATVFWPGQEGDLRPCQEVPGSQPLPAVPELGPGAIEGHGGLLPQPGHPRLSAVRHDRVQRTSHCVQPPSRPAPEVGRVGGSVSSPPLGTAAGQGSPGSRLPLSIPSPFFWTFLSAARGGGERRWNPGPSEYQADAGHPHTKGNLPQSKPGNRVGDGASVHIASGCA